RQVLWHGLGLGSGLLRLLALASRVPRRTRHTEPLQQVVQPRRRLRRLLLLRNHRAHRIRQLKSPESFFKMRLAIVISPITWSRSASSAFSRSIVLASSDRAPRPVSASLPPLRNSSRHRYSVCSDIPARRAICTAGSSLLNRRNTIWARCSALNVDFFPISPLLLRNTTSITDLRVQRNRSYTLSVGLCVSAVVVGFLAATRPSGFPAHDAQFRPVDTETRTPPSPEVHLHESRWNALSRAVALYAVVALGTGKIAPLRTSNLVTTASTAGSVQILIGSNTCPLQLLACAACSYRALRVASVMSFCLGNLFLNNGDSLDPDDGVEPRKCTT